MLQQVRPRESPQQQLPYYKRKCLGAEKGLLEHEGIHACRDTTQVLLAATAEPLPQLLDALTVVYTVLLAMAPPHTISASGDLLQRLWSGGKGTREYLASYMR